MDKQQREALAAAKRRYECPHCGHVSLVRKHVRARYCRRCERHGEMNKEQLENEVRANLQALARGIKHSLPEGFVFALLVTTPGHDGTLLYAANIDRADVLQLMREFIAANREERVWAREMPEVELQEEFEAWWATQRVRKGISAPSMQADIPVEERLSPLDMHLREWCQDAFNAGRASA
ncbi:MAG TPA: hypothetical protein VFO40_15635 [Chthoniobacterales bacterium]|nr:hypothetical protein [Chthoniobacterales bacterium]